MTKEEFIEEFKQKVVNGIYWNLPKEYRKSEEYEKLSLEQKYQQATQNSKFPSILKNIISEYYEKLNEEEN